MRWVQRQLSADGCSHSAPTKCPQVAAAKPTATAGDEDMSRRLAVAELPNDFVCDHGVTLHNLTGDVGILRGFFIRYGKVTEPLRVRVRALHRSIITSRYPHHLCAIGRNRFLSTGANAVVHVNHASTAEHAGTPRQRSPVIARSCRRDDNLSRHRFVLPIYQVLCIATVSTPVAFLISPFNTDSMA